MSLFPILGYAANSFLDTPDDQPVSVKFRGTEWSEDIGEKDIPLTAIVVTTRIAKMSWGAIFKVEFTDLKSRAEKQREIRPDYYIVTNDRIVLLNEEDNDTAAKRISALEKPPASQHSSLLSFMALPSSACTTCAPPLKPPESRMLYLQCPDRCAFPLSSNFFRWFGLPLEKE